MEYKAKIPNAKYKENGIENSEWNEAFVTCEGEPQYINEFKFDDCRVTACVDPTGYSVIDLAKVENVFENNTKIHISEYNFRSKEDVEQDQYNGLMAVVEVLCEIDNIEDVKFYKEMFTVS